MKFWSGSKHPNVFSYSVLLVLSSVSTEAQYMRYVTISINRKPAVKRVEDRQIVQWIELIIFAPLAQFLG